MLHHDAAFRLLAAIIFVACCIREPLAVLDVHLPSNAHGPHVIAYRGLETWEGRPRAVYFRPGSRIAITEVARCSEVRYIYRFFEDGHPIAEVASFAPAPHRRVVVKGCIQNSGVHYQSLYIANPGELIPTVPPSEMPSAHDVMRALRESGGPAR